MTLKEIRKSKGLTLETVSKAIGIHYSALSKIERGEYPLKMNIMKKLMNFYGIEDYDDLETKNETIERLTMERDMLKHENEKLYEIINDLKRIIKDL